MSKDLLIKELQLEPHVEGGYFQQTYVSAGKKKIQKDDGSRPERHIMTSIYYMLTEDSPIGHFHRNSSDIVHYHHIMGLSLKYHILDPEGEVSSIVLGPNIAAGERPQVIVKAGCWKATELLPNKRYDYGLLSEAVNPGFNYADWSIATEEDIKVLLPNTWKTWKRFIKKDHS